MKQFICDCCEKVAGAHYGEKAPEGWGKGTLSVRAGYSHAVNLRADICPECMKAFQEERSDWWRALKNLVKKKDK